MERCLRKTEQMFKRMKKEDLAAVAAIVGIYGIMGMLGITCPILFMTGVSCAGCGMTRAWLSLFWLPALIMILLLLDKRIFKQWYWLWAALFLLVYGIRMFIGQGDIVVFRPEEGFLFRVIVRMVL